MTRRDRWWRYGGGALYPAGLAIGLAGQTPAAADSPVLASLLAPAGIAVAVAGLLLSVQGKRVGVAWRATLRRHLRPAPRQPRR